MRRDRTLVTPTCHQRNHGSASMTKHTIAFAIALLAAPAADATVVDDACRPK